MKSLLKKVGGFLIFLIGTHSFIYAQVYGPELILNGDFGTIKRNGKNGDNGVGEYIYPDVVSQSATIGMFYQPPEKGFYAWGGLSAENLGIYPILTIGPPLQNETSYKWGMNVSGGSSYYFSNLENGNSNIPIPYGPTDGAYIIGTTTKGIFNDPLAGASWHIVYDKNETNLSAPTNYFMIVNSDDDPTKIFFKTEVEVTPGQVYRMSVDIARLNITGTPPNVDFVISADENSLTTDPSVYSTGNISEADGGKWLEFYFDYIAPCTEDGLPYKVYIAFRNINAGGDGNDLALDNLSFKAIVPEIQATAIDGDNCNKILELTGGLEGVLSTGNYRYAWQKQSLLGGGFYGISGSTYYQYATSEPGNYRLAVYSNEPDTYGCPMYSNVIKLEIDTDGESECPDLRVPRAVTDYVNAQAGTTVYFNVLDNDQTSGASVPRSNLIYIQCVAQWATNVTPAGEIAAVINGAGTTIATLLIQKDGTAEFTSISGYSGTLVFPYLIREENGGQSNAYIYVTVVPYSMDIDASCIDNPVNIRIGIDTDTPSEYTIMKGTTVMATATKDDEYLNFSFNETTIGAMTYSLRRNGTAMVTLYATVYPSSATWRPDLSVESQHWSESANWATDYGINLHPIWCTDVIIPGDVDYFPIISEDVDVDQCRDITFRHNAAVGHVQRLLYRKAFVEYTPLRNQLTMLTDPLKYIYSADYHADPTWGATAAIHPKVYMRYFDVDYENYNKPNPDGVYGASYGSFSRAFADLKEKMEMGNGYMVTVEDGTNAVFDGTFRFPRLNADGTEVLFKYHYTDDGTWVENGDPVDSKYYPFYFTDPGESGRGTEEPPTDAEWIADHSNPRGADHRYRFVHESSPIPTPVTITLPHEGTTNIVGNPFMAHLCFETFLRMNEDNIYPYYRIWDGEGFHSYMIGGTRDNEVWEGLPDEVSTLDQGSQFIAPMQGFFIQMRENKTQVVFDPDSICLHPHNAAEAQLRSSKAKSQNILSLRLKMGDKEDITMIGLFPSAKDEYDPEEDIFKLFSYEKSTPEIYTVVDGNALEINAMEKTEYNKNIPIGIKTTQTGEITISLEGGDNFVQYSEISLYDAQEGITYNLKQFPSVSFIKTREENVEGRFYLRLAGEITNSWQADESEALQVLVNDGWIIASSPSSKITEMHVYDTAGKLQYNKTNIAASYFKDNPYLIKGIYIIKVKTENEEKNVKVVF
ncbi:MAG: T9SS type A sorting domain-containing protein [Candidatus Azobacteroides sp.]|nr:T9SS type A sorting domain-containing protein [Candidatus Azobacteroides sp.]